MGLPEPGDGVKLDAAAVGDFTHRMSQPLTAIMGYAEMLTRRLPAGTNESHFAARILAEAERLAGMLAALGEAAKSGTEDVPLPTGDETFDKED